MNESTVADWHHNQLAIETRLFELSTAEALCAVHDETHVLDILEGRKNNGHGNRILEVSESCLWTVGSFVAAIVDAAITVRVLSRLHQEDTAEIHNPICWLNLRLSNESHRQFPR